jgi:hypothetical protein
MSDSTNVQHVGLTEYEARQVAEIAAWKGCRPHVIEELFNLVATQVARVIEKVIPDTFAHKGISALYDTADRAAGQEGIVRKMGVGDLGELRDWPLEKCDCLAKKVGLGALGVCAAGGGVTGAGGTLTIALDVSLLFALAMRTIIKIGRSYGYSLEGTSGRAFVLGILITALAESREKMWQTCLTRLHEVEDKMLIEAQEEILVEESASFLFQLEALGEIPGMGAVTVCLLHLWLIHRVERTARLVFQERRLRDWGKVDVIEPTARAHRGIDGAGPVGIAGRATYGIIHQFAFAVTFPVFFVGAGLEPVGNVLAWTLRKVVPAQGLVA